jgi:hypothetical protein
MVKKVVVAVFSLGLLASPESARTGSMRMTVTQAPVSEVPQEPSAVGYLRLDKRHPDGAEGLEDFTSNFSADQALQRLAQMRSFLASFRDLTDHVRRQLSATQLQTLGNTGRDVQTIGFHNIPLTVEGTILKQEYQLKQAQYQLAQLRLERGDISAQELAKARSAFAAATSRFQTFWDTKKPTD